MKIARFRYGMLGLGVLTFLFLLGPLLVALPLAITKSDYLGWPTDGLSSKWFVELWSNAAWREPIENSFVTAIAASSLAVSLALPAALSLSKHRKVWDVRLSAILYLPIVIPTVSIATGLYFVYAKIKLIDTELGLILAHAALLTPYTFLLLSASINTYLHRLQDIAQSFGASTTLTWLRVILPQIYAGIAASFVISFVFSFEEPVISLFITGARTRTLPRQLYDGLRYDLTPASAAAAVLSITLTMFIFLSMNRTLLRASGRVS